MAVHHTSGLNRFPGATTTAARQPGPEHEHCRRTGRHQRGHAVIGVAAVGAFDVGSSDRVDEPIEDPGLDRP